jgi:hypothetical protein
VEVIMPMFRVVKTIQYTEELDVDAVDKESAEAIALEQPCKRNNDDTLHDIQTSLVPQSDAAQA